MKEKEFVILNDQLKNDEYRDMISYLVESMINFYKLKYLRDWERNHNIDKSIYDNKMSELRNIKNDIIKNLESGQEVNLESIIKIKTN